MADRADLRRTQELFWKLITAPEGVGPGLEEMARRKELEAGDISWMIRGDERLSGKERLNIYASMYFYRLRDCLADDFPKVAAVVGGARFHNLITDYLLVHPPTSWSLRDAGADLPRYLAGHKLSEEYPYAADLARLEWSRIEVFDEADSGTLTRDALTSNSGGKAQDLRLRTVPALRLMKLDWNIAPLWLELDQAQGDDESAEPNSAAAGGDQEFETRPPAKIRTPARSDLFIAAWRQELLLYHRSMRADEYACLRAMSKEGATLPLLCDIILGKQAEGRVAADPVRRQNDAAQRMATLLDLWMKEGLVRAL